MVIILILLGSKRPISQRITTRQNDGIKKERFNRLNETI